MKIIISRRIQIIIDKSVISYLITAGHVIITVLKPDGAATSLVYLCVLRLLQLWLSLYVVVLISTNGTRTSNVIVITGRWKPTFSYVVAILSARCLCYGVRSRFVVVVSLFSNYRVVDFVCVFRACRGGLWQRRNGEGVPSWMQFTALEWSCTFFVLISSDNEIKNSFFPYIIYIV